MKSRSLYMIMFFILSTITVMFIERVFAFDGDATFFYPGLGACGKTNSSKDFIFALPAVMFDPSPGGNPNRNRNCGRKARVTRGKKSVVVTCEDRCTG